MKNRTRAIIFLIMASMLWSTGGVLIKYIPWSPITIAGMRSGIAAVVMMAYIRKPIKLQKFKVVGSIFYCAMMILFVTATKMTTAANAILLQYSAPIWVAILSGIILKEKIQRREWITIMVVMGGMILFFMGDLQTGAMLGNGLAVLSGIAFAGAIVSLKLVKDSSPAEIPLLGNVLTFLVCLPFLSGITLDVKSVLAILALGIFQIGIAYILFTEGSRYVSAIEAVLIAVIEPLLNPIWVFFFNGEVPGGMAIIGGSVVVIAIVWNNIQKSKIGIESKNT
jgi:drug/metabolite transporter (DMT)-like permease